MAQYTVDNCLPANTTGPPPILASETKPLTASSPHIPNKLPFDIEKSASAPGHTNYPKYSKFHFLAPTGALAPKKSADTTQGWAGIPASLDSREYKPQIYLPFPWHFVISLPVPGKRNFWPGIKTGNTIIICSLADGWSRHENKWNVEFNLAFYMIPGNSRDSRDYKPQISHSLPFP